MARGLRSPLSTGTVTHWRGELATLGRRPWGPGHGGIEEPHRIQAGEDRGPRTRGVFVPINTELKGAFLQHQLRNSEPHVLFLEYDLRDAFDNVAGGKELDNVVLLDYCAERIPRFAVPRYIEVLEALPKSATGKIQKDLLREANVPDQTWDRDSVGYQIERRAQLRARSAG